MSGKVACVKVLVEAGANKEAIGKSNVKPSPRPSPPGPLCHENLTTFEITEPDRGGC